MKIPFSKKHLAAEPAHSDLASRDLDAEGPDAEWLEKEAAKRREAFDRERAQERIARLARREREPLNRRLFGVESAIVLASTSKAAGGGEGSGGKPDSKAPPPADSMEVGRAHPDEARRLLRIVKDAVRKLEALVDEQQYAGAARPDLFGSDLDELLRTQYRGYSPEDVALLEPSLGTAAAVRKSRANMNLHRESGDPLPPDKRRQL
jgi:hypothetical protein